MRVQGTLALKAGVATGTIAAVMGEIWLDTATSEPPASHGIFRAIRWWRYYELAATVNNLFMIDGVTIDAASGSTDKMVTTGCAGASIVGSVKIRIRINGTPYWLLATAVTPAAS